jgi:hypothetical protein
MAHMNQVKKAKIAANLKPILAKYGVKASLSVNNHSSIVLTVKSGKIDFISNFNKVCGERDNNRFGSFNPATDYVDVNEYWYHEHFSGKAKKFLDEALKALKSADWFDESDSQTDYFHTAYYVDVQIGRWNKPYVLEAV